MTKSRLFKEAHRLTKQIMEQYSNLNYRTQFGISLKFLQQKKKTAYETIEEIFNSEINSWGKFELNYISSKNWMNKRIYITVDFGRHQIQCYKDLKDGYFYCKKYTNGTCNRILSKICDALTIYTNEELEEI